MGLPGNFYPAQREGYHRGDSFNDLPQNSRVQNPTPIHPRPLPIQDALRNCCSIPAKEFVIILIDDHGEERVYTSPSLSPYSSNIATERFRKDFRRNVRTARSDGGHRQPTSYSPTGMYEIEMDSGRESRKSSIASSVENRRNRQQGKSKSDESDEEGPRGSRKRPRLPRTYRQNSNDEVSVPTRKTQPVRIDDEAEIEKLYYLRFKDMQQSSCKIMGKAFVKLVEPKKQTHHPYTGGNDKCPPWWPNTTGENAVRHKEPDHLLKPERTRLLVHILKMVIEPNAKQCASIQKLDLNVKKLEEATLDVMLHWFNDKEHPENAQKKGFLKEIFKVAKAQEQYKNGEIDGTTMIPIMYGDKSGADASEDENDEDSFNEEDGSHQQIPTPESLIVSPPLMQGPRHHSQQQMHEVENHIGQRIRSGLVMRTLTQPPPSMREHAQFDDQQYFGQRMDVNFQPPQSPSLGDAARRNFISHEYQSSQSNIHNWQQPMINSSTSAASSNHYSTSPQSSLPPLNSPYLPPPSQQQMHPPQVPHQFQFTELSHGLPTNRSFEASSPLGHPMRTGSLPTYLPQQNFEGYLQENNSFSSHEQDLKEEQHQHMSQNQ